MPRWAICRAASLLSLLLAAGPAAAQQSGQDAPAPASDGCLAANARYAPNGDPTAGAELVLAEREVPSAYSDLDLVVVAPALAVPEPLEMIQSQGFGSIGAYPVPNGLLSDASGFPLAFLARDVNGVLVVLDAIPQGGDPAPEAVMVAGLESALWYATNGQALPVALRPSLWHLQPCG